MKESLKATYNKLSASYEKNAEDDMLYNLYYERPAMLDVLPDSLSGKKVLDAGCSSGWYSAELLKRGADVTALDFSPEMVEATKRKLGNRPEIICHDLEEPLPFLDNEFHLVVSSLTLHYIKDWQPTLREFSRVLKPQGLLHYSVHHPFMDFRQFACEDYFKTELLQDRWTKSTGTYDVQFYRRPLGDIIAATSRNFMIDELKEPRPVKEMKKLDEKSYSKLMKNPHFLIIKAYAK